MSSWYDASASDRGDVGVQGAVHERPLFLGRLAPAPDAGALEHQPGRAHVAHGVGLRARDRDPAVGLAGGQPLGDQHGERLAHGRPRDAQRGGDRDLAQRRTGLELAVEDGPAQLVGDPVDGRGVLEAEGAERRVLGWFSAASAHGVAPASRLAGVAPVRHTSACQIV